MNDLQIDIYKSKDTTDTFFGLKLVVSRPTGSTSTIPLEVFVFQRDTTGDVGDEFFGVVTPVDIDDIKTEALAEDDAAFYRSDTVELWFNNANDFDRYIQAIPARITELVAELNALASYASHTTVVV